MSCGALQALSLATRSGGKDLPESEVILEACGIGFLLHRLENPGFDQAELFVIEGNISSASVGPHYPVGGYLKTAFVRSISIFPCFCQWAQLGVGY